MDDTNNAPGADDQSDLVQELAAEKAAHDATRAQLEALRQSHDDATGALSDAAEIIDGHKQTIADLEQTIQTMQTSPAEFPLIKVGKVVYAVEAKNFGYKGVQYTAEQLLEDKALQAELVKKGVGFLVKQEN